MYKLVQTKKELTTASFQVLNDYGQVIGNAFVSGKVLSHEYSIYLKYLGSVIQMYPCSKRLVKEVDDCYRPFSIIMDNNFVGYIYQIERKSGFLKRMCIQVLKYNGKEYEMYSIGLGRDGVACCLYKDDEQVGLIEKDGVVYDDLHSYEIYDKNGNYLYFLLLYSLYKYALTCFTTRTYSIASVSISASKTTDKKLLEKYNPKFKEECLRGSKA